MKTLSVLTWLILSMLGCQTPQSISQRAMASASLADVNYSFDSSRVQNCKNTFHFVRSFVDYFYLVVKANQGELFVAKNFSGFSGLCVGDAHAENFGALVQENGIPKFTVNDFDDFGPCPVAYDLYRFMMSSAAYDSTLDLDRIRDFYVKGLRGENVAPPAVVQKMLVTSQTRGSSLNPKKILNSKFIRDGSSSEVGPEVIVAVKKFLFQWSPTSQVLDIIKTVKDSGGSAGLTRYQVLVSIYGQVQHLEFKAQVKPSIYPVATAALPSANAKIFDALRVEQGPQASKLYGYAQILNTDMLIRPLFWGNVGVSLGNNQADDFDTIYFEAYTLGQIHRASVSDLDGYMKALQMHDIEEWKSDVKMMVDFMHRKYKSLP